MSCHNPGHFLAGSLERWLPCGSLKVLLAQRRSLTFGRRCCRKARVQSAIKPAAWPRGCFCTTLDTLNTSRVSPDEGDPGTEQPSEGWTLLGLKFRWSLSMRPSNCSCWLRRRDCQRGLEVTRLVFFRSFDTRPATPRTQKCRHCLRRDSLRKSSSPRDAGAWPSRCEVGTGYRGENFTVTLAYSARPVRYSTSGFPHRISCNIAACCFQPGPLKNPQPVQICGRD